MGWLWALNDRSCPRSLEVGTTGYMDRAGLTCGIDFVGEDVIVKRFGDGLVEPGQQLGQGLAVAAHQHGQGVVPVGGHGDTADGIHFAESDLTVIDELGDMRQGQEIDCGVAVGCWFLYAAG